MTTLDLPRLRTITEAATPGKREHNGAGLVIIEQPAGWQLADLTWDSDGDEMKANAEQIATFDRETCLALLDAAADNARLRERVRVLESGIRPFAKWADLLDYDRLGSESTDSLPLGWQGDPGHIRPTIGSPTVGQLRTLASLLTETPCPT